jgi:hypothetical protein
VKSHDQNYKNFRIAKALRNRSDGNQTTLKRDFFNTPGQGGWGRTPRTSAFLDPEVRAKWERLPRRSWVACLVVRNDVKRRDEPGRYRLFEDPAIGCAETTPPDTPLRKGGKDGARLASRKCPLAIDDVRR